MNKNVDERTVAGFGREWQHFDQSALSLADSARIFDEYFHIFPWSRIAADAKGFDLGCGSGRWAAVVAPRVGELHCIDASAQALEVARRNLCSHANVVFHHASVDDMPLRDGWADFGYSLGVLHHVPDTRAALHCCSAKLKPGAPFLVYLYYRFDNRPPWYRGIWRVADMGRRVISRLPFSLRLALSQIIAVIVYWPAARFAGIGERLGYASEQWPLGYYRNKTFYVMRTDALDRFGTRLERRFTRQEIEYLLLQAGFRDVKFSESAPYWCAVAVKR